MMNFMFHLHLPQLFNFVINKYFEGRHVLINDSTSYYLLVPGSNITTFMMLSFPIPDQGSVGLSPHL